MSRRKEFWSGYLRPEQLPWLRERAKATGQPVTSFVEEAVALLQAEHERNAKLGVAA